MVLIRLMELMAMITQVLNEKGWSVETSLVHVSVLPINWLPSIRMTCCITESTPHASLTKWKIINSLHGQMPESVGLLLRNGRKLVDL